ncbi:MAG: hypothetical protein ACTHK1_02380 [Actinomycetales bacterium]
MATIPARESGLRVVVESMLDQAEEVCVYLNGYEEVPDWLAAAPRVVARLGEDLGDRGKFAFVDGFDGVYLTVDDDIAYPPDYVAATVSGLQRYPGAVVGWHGSLLDPDITDYYDHSKRHVFNHGRACLRDEVVHVLGTGALGFDTRALSVSLRDFEVPNTADLYFARLCQRQAVPQVVLAHPPGWAPPIPFPREATIWGASVDNNASRFDTRTAAAALLPELAAMRLSTLATAGPLAVLRVRDAERAVGVEAALRTLLMPFRIAVATIADEAAHSAGAAPMTATDSGAAENRPSGWTVSAATDGGTLVLTGDHGRVRFPWPLLLGPDTAAVDPSGVVLAAEPERHASLTRRLAEEELHHVTVVNPLSPLDRHPGQLLLWAIPRLAGAPDDGTCLAAAAFEPVVEADLVATVRRLLDRPDVAAAMLDAQLAATGRRARTKCGSALWNWLQEQA